jgi:hypothetical protein
MPMRRSIESLESASVGLKSLGSLLAQTLVLTSSLPALARYSAYSLLRMSLAHSRLVVMVVYLCFLTRLPVLLLPLELPVVELLLEAVVLLEALVQVVAVLVDLTDSLDLQDCSCLLDSSDSLRNCFV